MGRTDNEPALTRRAFLGRAAAGAGAGVAATAAGPGSAEAFSLLRVPEAPGLGVTLNSEELERLENRKPPEKKRWIVKSQFKNGTKMYHVADPPCPSFLCRPDRARHIDLSYDSPVSTEYWDDDGWPEFKAMLERIEREDMVLEK